MLGLGNTLGCLLTLNQQHPDSSFSPLHSAPQSISLTSREIQQVASLRYFGEIFEDRLKQQGRWIKKNFGNVLNIVKILNEVWNQEFGGNYFEGICITVESITETDRYCRGSRFRSFSCKPGCIVRNFSEAQQSRLL